MHRSRGRLLAACASTTSADRCFNEHYHGPPEHPGPAEFVVGTAADSIDRCLSIDGDRRGYARSGAEDHRASALPPGIAPERDFAPTPIASDTSCRGHCPSPCQEFDEGGRTKPPAPLTLARHERREGRATPDFREEIRRSPTRGAFHRKAVRKRGATSRAA